VEVVEIDPRPVTIYEFEITNIELPVVHFRVRCSTGTYIRSLANDFGAALGVGGYLSSLRRTKIGSFAVEDAMQITAFEQHIAALKGETNTEL
jgi:tRNA pseudouridine55 synthase